MIAHIVARGETSAMIARRYGITQKALFAANPNLRLVVNKYQEVDFAPSQFVQGVRLNVPVHFSTGQVGCGGGISPQTWRRVLGSDSSRPGTVGNIELPLESEDIDLLPSTPRAMDPRRFSATARPGSSQAPSPRPIPHPGWPRPGTVGNIELPLDPDAVDPRNFTATGRPALSPVVASAPRAPTPRPIPRPGWPLVYEAQGFGWPPVRSTLKTQLSPVQLQTMLQRVDYARAQAFASAYRPGDEIWLYDSMTAPLSGARGVYVLRDGNVVADLTFVVS